MPTQILFCDSFDHYASADLAKKYFSAGGSIAAVGRNSTNGYQGLAANFSSWLQVQTANQPSLYVDVAFKATAIPGGDTEFLMLNDGSSLQTELRITATGELRVTRNGTSLAVTSGLGMVAGTYYHIGFMTTFHNSAGVYEVRVNGIQKLIGSGADTQNTANAYGNRVILQSVASGGTYFDDFIVSADGFCGDCKVMAIFPQGAGNYSQWVPSAGLGYQCVDETSMNSDTDYVSTATAGQRNSYDFAAVGAGAIKAVQHVATVRKDATGSRSVKQFARVSGTDYDASAVSVADTYLMQRRVMVTNPATSADWTAAGLDASEFGTLLDS